LPLADVPDRERRDGGPELVIVHKDAVIPMPVLARRRHEMCVGGARSGRGRCAEKRHDILITDQGPVDLTADIPREADEIEALMSR
jgi:hypothetical protein